ncbi:hypothetical protein ABW19_dt0206572 [Dactylella cylindrospora]|nr:hypothetical protein ABW19_dt0206572 [Dactylella cylindrospora]
MATGGKIDALKLEKWEDAFDQPVQSVRVMEKQLRIALHEKKEGLRALVGESYRDLLKTAERIVEMNGSIQQVESHLSLASKQCNYGYVQKKAANAVELKEKQDNKERQLSNLRVTILRNIEQDVCRLDADPAKILQCLGAYSLITSSSTSDTFQEFQNLRLTAITGLLGQDTVSTETILEAIKLVNETLRLSKQLFPKRLSDTLSNLKLKPIFQEPAVNDMMELNMAVHGHWISENIRIYTPWLKVDDLSNSNCKSEIASKLGDALSAVFEGLEKAVREVHQVEDLVRIRGDILVASRGILRRTSDLEDENLKQILAKAREIVNTRIREVLNNDVAGIGDLSQDLSKLVSNSSTSIKRGEIY